MQSLDNNSWRSDPCTTALDTLQSESTASSGQCDGHIPQCSSLALEGLQQLLRAGLGLQRGPAETLHASLLLALAEALQESQAVNTPTLVGSPSHTIKFCSSGLDQYKDSADRPQSCTCGSVIIAIQHMCQHMHAADFAICS